MDIKSRYKLDLFEIRQNNRLLIVDFDNYKIKYYRIYKNEFCYCEKVTLIKEWQRNSIYDLLYHTDKFNKDIKLDTYKTIEME